MFFFIFFVLKIKRHLFLYILAHKLEKYIFSNEIVFGASGKIGIGLFLLEEDVFLIFI